MISALVKKNQLIQQSISKYSATAVKTVGSNIFKNDITLFSTHKSSKSTSSPLLSNTKLNKHNNTNNYNNNNNNNNTINNNNNNTINNNNNISNKIDNVNKLKTHYYPNGLVKSKSLILDILKSKRLTVFILYWTIVSPGLEPLTIGNDIDVLFYTDLLSLSIFGIGVYDLLIKSNVRNKFYELTVLELLHYRDSIELIIKQPFQVPSMNDCKFEINRLYSYDNMLNDEKRLKKENEKQQQHTSSSTKKTKNIDQKSYSLKRKLIKCTFSIQLDSIGSSSGGIKRIATVTAIGEASNKLFSLNSILNLGKRIPLDEKYQFKELTINIEPENKNFIIYKDSL